jgi:hypothetical protein
MTVKEDVRVTSDLRGRLLLAGRLGMAVLIPAAILGQLLTSLEFWSARGGTDLGLNLVAYGSLFTVQSNTASAVLLLIFVVAHLGRARLGRRFDVALLCTTTCMLVTGLVYNVLMRAIELPEGATLGWANEVLHVAAPLWMLLDWTLAARHRQVHWRDLPAVVAFPMLWLGCTLLRAPRTPEEAAGNPYWYPHLDPATYANGGFGVATTCLAITAALLLLATALITFARWRVLARG